MPDQERVVLAIPAMPQFIRLARVTASGLATRLGFDIDEIEDLRLAIDEACFSVIGTGVEGEELSLTYLVDDKSLSVDGTIDVRSSKERIEASGATAPVAHHDMSHLILSALVDEHNIEHLETASTFHFTKAIHA